MIAAFRIVKRKYAGEPLSGRGGLAVGGRWHHPGAPIVYCAESLSLAALKFFVHFGKHQKSIVLAAIEVRIPKNLVEIFPIESLPADWREIPSPQATADLGTEWLKAGRSAVLCVPSVLAAGEHNYLINPAHPAAARITTNPPEPYSFDPRMWK